MEAPYRTKAPKPVPSYSFYKVVTGLFAVAAIFALAAWLANSSTPVLGGLIDSASFAQKNFVMKSFMLLFTLAVMWGIHQKTGLSFGFTKGDHLNYSRFTKHAVLLAIAGLFTLIIFNIINMVITRTPPVGFPDEKLLSRILFIWIWSSVVEEILVRGLFQSWLGDLRRTVFRFRKADISLAVLLSGLVFAAMHLSLLFQGMSAMFVAGIFVHTLLLGLLAGYLREKTGSLYPAIYVHIIFNIVGSAPLILQALIKQ